jgi:hypothetical protein
VQRVIETWVAAYGDMKWIRFEAQNMPDDPVSFLEAWNAAQNDLNSVLAEHEESIRVIDETVAQIYDVPVDLRNVLRDGPPWLAGRGLATMEENGEDEET